MWSVWKKGGEGGNEIGAGCEAFVIDVMLDWLG